MSQMTFTVRQSDTLSSARWGQFTTAHGTFETPVFMPVGTRGAVKTLTNEQLIGIGAEIILGNTYHLLLRPGIEVLREAGGLHRFMNWPRSILTDSGGFQVFSLSALRKVTDAGVAFQSHIDGARCFIGPDESMEMQRILGSDIVMAFDECSAYPAERAALEMALERTTRWAIRCRNYTLLAHQNLFGIVQGGIHPDLRRESAVQLTALDFEGYAIGGLSVGEPREIMNTTLDATVPFLPADKPRYLMGVGTPRNIVEAVMRGIDMFDCVMPTRNARNGTAFTWAGKVSIKSARYARDFTPLDPNVPCYTGQFSRAYLRHLLSVNEFTGLTLVSLHNLAFYLDFMRQLRQAIRDQELPSFYARICAVYPD